MKRSADHDETPEALDTAERRADAEDFPEVESEGSREEEGSMSTEEMMAASFHADGNPVVAKLLQAERERGAKVADALVGREPDDLDVAEEIAARIRSGA